MFGCQLMVYTSSGNVVDVVPNSVVEEDVEVVDVVVVNVVDDVPEGWLSKQPPIKTRTVRKTSKRMLNNAFFCLKCWRFKSGIQHSF